MFNNVLGLKPLNPNIIITSVFIANLISGCKGDENKNDELSQPVILQQEEGQWSHLWTVNYDSSSIKFTATEGEESFTGSFSRFDILIDFHVDDPTSGTISALIDLSTVSAGNADRDDMLATQYFFDLKSYPIGRFFSDDIRMISEGRYEAHGTLSLKGISKNIILPFELDHKTSVAQASASYMIDRTDFQIGTGAYSGTDKVGYNVNVDIFVGAKRLETQK